MVFLNKTIEPISYEKAKKILEQLEKCICRIELGIEIKKDNQFGSGFFCFIRYKNKKLPVLISIFLKDENIFKQKEILIDIKNEKNYLCK